MTPRLVAVCGPLEGQSFELRSDRFAVGRQAGNDLRLAGVEVSRWHCKLRREAGARFILHAPGLRSASSVMAIKRVLTDPPPGKRGAGAEGAGWLLTLGLGQLDPSCLHVESAHVGSGQRGHRVARCLERR